MRQLNFMSHLYSSGGGVNPLPPVKFQRLMFYQKLSPYWNVILLDGKKRE